LEKENAQVGYCSMQCFDSETEIQGGVWGPTPHDLNHFPQNLFSRNFINPSGAICHQTLFQSHQFDPNPKIQSCEDHDLWLTLVSQGAKFVYVPEVKVLYRKNHSGAATGNRERMLLADIEVMKKQWDNPAFSNKTKKEGLSQNYGLLGEYYFSQGSLKAVESLMKSWFYQPLHFKRARRVLKVLALFCCRTFRSGKIVDTKV
jgi:GT2 family glycosyltransferase